jgi:sec-independent protein translocase protein TatA
MPFGLHTWDLLIVVVAALLIFGPKRLPEMGNAVGKTIREFRKSMSEITEGKKETPAAVEAPLPPVESPVPSAPVATQITAESTSNSEQPVS